MPALLPIDALKIYDDKTTGVVLLWRSIGDTSYERTTTSRRFVPPISDRVPFLGMLLAIERQGGPRAPRPVACKRQLKGNC